MAVDLFSENSSMSPRISFSRDFCQSDVIPIEQRPLRSSKASSLNSSIDFDFCLAGDQESYTADEFFSDGKILPTEIKNKTEPAKQQNAGQPVHANQNTFRPESGKQETARPESSKHEKGRPGSGKREMGQTEPGKQLTPRPESEKATMVTRDETGGDEEVMMEEKPNTKSFWGFKRSSSLNCGSGYGRSLCPLPLLSRSNSTGSTSNVSTKQKQSSKKQEHIKQFQSARNNYQKPPLKKNYGGYYGNGVRVNTVLNVPSGNLFGLGSIFSGGSKDKNKKR